MSKLVEPKKVSYSRTYRVQKFLRKDFKETYLSKIEYLEKKYLEYKVFPKDYEELIEPTEGSISGQDWWNRISRPIPKVEDEIVCCRYCEADFKNLSDIRNKNMDYTNYGFLCTSSCLWFDYFWFLFHSDEIYKKF